ncbi:hypothetical protein TrCOL_g11282 [Triparma columacea]|uniref:Glycosyl transferase 64 domain-containing protein n=1 Tax=Triparma columacea TaxID=722753 RepID=A0A9W7FYV5_9STRA|nr:hypothetical protein TrCOL_g11282 [Triparma columacea]
MLPSHKRVFVYVFLGSVSLILTFIAITPRHLNHRVAKTTLFEQRLRPKNSIYGVERVDVSAAGATFDRGFILKSGEEITFAVTVFPRFGESQPNARVTNLKRTCDSLLGADYGGAKNINLLFNIDLDTPRDVLEYLSGFSWPHGEKSLHYQLRTKGAETTLGQYWFPAQPGEHGILLEEGVVVSPSYFLFLLQALRVLHSDPISKVLGICLGAPDTSTAGQLEAFDDSIEPYVLRSSPCLSGGMFLPQAWANIVQENSAWLQRRTEVVKTPSEAASGRVMFSFESFMKNRMAVKDQLMIYPKLSKGRLLDDFAGRPGVGKQVLMELPDNEDDIWEISNFFELPSSFDGMEIYDSSGQRVISLSCLSQGKQCYSHFLASGQLTKRQNREEVCKTFSKVGSILNLPKEADQMTIIIDQSAGNVEMPVIAKQLEYYAKSPMVVAIIVALRDDKGEVVPPPVQIGNVFVSFTLRSPLSKNSRFLPLPKISTECVILVDAGVRVHLDDIVMVHHVWKKNKEQIVGFFPSLYKASNKGSSYSAMKTTFMVLHVKFLEGYSCDGAMALVRNKVDHFGGCEDIAMSFYVTRYTTSPAPLFVHPLHRVVRFDTAETRTTELVEPRIRRECAYNFADNLLQHDVKNTPSQHLEVHTSSQSRTGTTVMLELTEFDDSKYKGKSGHQHDVEVKCFFDTTENHWRVKESSGGLPPFARDSVDEGNLCEVAWLVGRSQEKIRLEYKRGKKIDVGQT